MNREATAVSDLPYMMSYLKELPLMLSSAITLPRQLTYNGRYCSDGVRIFKILFATILQSLYLSLEITDQHCGGGGD